MRLSAEAAPAHAFKAAAEHEQGWDWIGTPPAERSARYERERKAKWRAERRAKGLPDRPTLAACAKLKAAVASTQARSTRTRREGAP
jgi:hypothetical protein